MDTILSESEKPIDCLLTMVEVQKRVGLSRPAIYANMRSGDFPSAFRVGRKALRWSEAELIRWLAGRRFNGAE